MTEATEKTIPMTSDGQIILPREWLNELGITNRVEMEKNGDAIIVRKPLPQSVI